VEVRSEIDRLFFEIAQHLHRERRHPRFSVTHGGGRIAIDRSEITLTLHERVAHREILREADDRVVHSGVAVRMVLTEHFTDDARALLVWAVRSETELVHPVEHAAMDWL